MPSPRDLLELTIDGQRVHASAGMTVLQAAEQHGIDIPTLCAHPDLTPFGGCRMCMTEIEGRRGYPLACTTPAESGMVVRTDSEKLRAERADVLQLILTEHPSSCMVCGEKTSCGEYMGSIRKVGVTSSCRTCPNDGQCELHALVERLGIEELAYEATYRGIRVEKSDPFFDRDYNLCILCGRCVRMCQEIRMTGTLAFLERGPATIVGTAFDRSHIDADCEFCGSCVDVCPTGTLAEKTRKWDGKPESETASTCPLCGVGCRLTLLSKGERFLGCAPARDVEIGRGQLCVKGRFCVPELVNGHDRLTSPRRAVEHGTIPCSWDEAFAEIAEKLSSCAPERFGMLVSGDCTNEDMYVAQKFVRSAMKSDNIDGSARLFLGGAFNPFAKLFEHSAPLSELDRASLIVAIGADVRYGGSVLGVRIRQAVKRGAGLITVHTRDHGLAKYANLSLLSSSETIAELIAQLASSTPADDELSAAARMMDEADRTVIVLGTDFLPLDDASRILAGVAEVAGRFDAPIYPLAPQGNLMGSLVMGTYPGLAPGAILTGPSPVRSSTQGDGHRSGVRSVAERLHDKDSPDVLISLGDFPREFAPHAECVIWLGLYPADAPHVGDLQLPVAAFTETDGTHIDVEGRLLDYRRSVDPPGQALPDWKILCGIARAMGAQGFDFDTIGDVQREMEEVVGLELDSLRESGEPVTIRSVARAPAMPWTLGDGGPMRPLSVHTYRGVDLSRRVKGFGRLVPEANGLSPATSDDIRKEHLKTRAQASAQQPISAGGEDV